MKTEIINEKIKNRTYPYIGKFDMFELYVLFSSKNTGTVLSGGKIYTLYENYEFAEDWIENRFIPLFPYTKVILSN